VIEELLMTEPKMARIFEGKAATDLVDENVSFDFKAFLKNVGPAPSFTEPLGPTEDCLSVDIIRSFHLKQLRETEHTLVEKHVTVCTTCSELLVSYATAVPNVGMPDKLFQRVSARLRRSSPKESSRSTARHWSMPVLGLRWVALPAAALVLVWVFYPTRPYLRSAASRFQNAWMALQPDKKEILVPNDPQEMRTILDQMIVESNRGRLPAPHQVDSMLASVAMKSASPSTNDSQAEWSKYRSEVAALDAMSHYEALRKNTVTAALPLRQLKITGLSDIDGVPTIRVENDQIENETVKELLEKSVKQSGIQRLYVYKDGKRIFDITIRPID
jgi:hypothetical protein